MFVWLVFFASSRQPRENFVSVLLSVAHIYHHAIDRRLLFYQNMEDFQLVVCKLGGEGTVFFPSIFLFLSHISCSLFYVHCSCLKIFKQRIDSLNP